MTEQNTSTDNQPEQQEQADLKNLPVYILGIILQPRKMLNRLIQKRGAIIPILIVALSLAAIRVVLLPEIMQSADEPETIEKYANQRGIAEAQAKQEIEIMRKTAPLMVFIESPLLVVSGVMVVAGIVYLIGRFQFNIRIRYIYIYRMVAWATVVSAFPLVFTIPLKLINTDWNLPTNLAFFLPDSLTDTFFFQISQTLDIFLIWEVWLISIGVSLLYKISIQRAVNAMGTMFLIFMVVNVLLSKQLP